MSLKPLTQYLESARTSEEWPLVVRDAWGRAGSRNGGTGHPVPDYHPELTVQELLSLYRTMVLSRRLDDRELALQKQGQAWFTISCAGKEAALVAAGLVLRPTDPIWTYYRDRALVLQRGVTAEEVLRQAVAAKDDPSSAGRQMAAHYGHAGKAVMSNLSPTGGHCIAAVGLAEAIAKGAKLGLRGTYPADAVVYGSLGDGTTAEGEVYEALRAAILYRTPSVIHLEDDGFGISVPVHEQVPGGDPLALFRGWPELKVIDVDGTDLRASYAAFREAVDHARSRRGPVLVRSRVLRLYSHSSTDDMKKYRPGRDIAIDLERDPIAKFARELIAYAVAAPEDLLKIHEEVEQEIEAAVQTVLGLPRTDAAGILDHVYSDRPEEAKRRYAEAVAGRQSSAAGSQLTLADAINQSLKEIFSVAPNAVAWGEDIADLSREMLQRHPELEGKGGVFGVTKGLQRAAGYDRVFNSPICEASIVGRAIGHALQGLLPIVEIQFRDYLNPAWQQLMDNAATMSWRSGGTFQCPMVIRMSYGGYLGGAGALWHSEAAAGPLLHYPGVRVCVPSNARDGAALLRAAAFCGDIVCFLEPKAIYRRKNEFLDTKYPNFDEVLWPGTSRTYGTGKDLAILTYGNTAHLCFEVMKQLEREKIRARMVDCLWLNPLDEAAIRAAADECGQVLIVDEDRRTCGAGAAIADVIYRDASLRRKVDVERLAAKDCRVSYGPTGERAVLPQVEDILSAARSLLLKK